MKVLIIYHCGLSDESKSFYRAFAGQGVDLSVIVPSKIVGAESYIPKGHFVFTKEEQSNNYKIYPVPLRKPESYGEGFKFFQLFKTIKEIKPDVIHVLDEYTSFYLFQVIICRNILFGRKVPVVCYASQSDISHFKSPPFVFASPKRFLKRIFRKILQPIVFWYHNLHLNGVEGCNDECLENIKLAGGKMPMEIIFWGVDLARFYPKDRALARKEIEVPQDIKLVGYVGRIAKEKGLDKLVKAVGLLKNYYLVLIGTGNFEKELDKIIEAAGMKEKVLRFKNIATEKLADYYNSFDIFVLPSETVPGWKEQYGRVLVEAMGCCLPVVGSSSGAISQTLSGYPKHLIFKEGSAEDLADKIKKVQSLNFPTGFDFKKFMEKYSCENFAKQSINFYEKIISELR